MCVCRRLSCYQNTTAYMCKELTPFYNEELYGVILDCFSSVWPQLSAGKEDMCVLAVCYYIMLRSTSAQGHVASPPIQK